MDRTLLPFAGMLFLAACASGPKAPPAHGGLNGAVVLAEARQLRTEKSCAQAAPAYRVAAGIGESVDAAQHELGECLLGMTGATPAETALFREEGLFWLRRSAFAGNARAERALALFYGARDNSLGSPAAALKWAMLYEKNGEADVYGYQGLPPTFVPGLKAALSAAEIDAAEDFARTFSPIALTPYRAGATPARAEDAAAPDQRPPERGRRRPPRR